MRRVDLYPLHPNNNPDKSPPLVRAGLLANEGVLPAGRDWLWLAAIVGIHGALLAGAMIGLAGQSRLSRPQR